MSGANDEILDRGDDLLPPDPQTNPADDKAALDAAAAEAETEPKAEEGADADAGKAADPEADSDAKPKGKKTANERIQELIRRGKEREADLQRQIAELQKATTVQKTSESLEAAEQQLSDLEEKYAQLMLDGATKDAAAVRQQMRQLERAITVAEARQEAAQAKDAVKAELAYDAAVATIESKWPMLNPDEEEFDGDLAQEVLELHTGLVAKGLAPSAAIQRAVRYVMADHGITAAGDRGDIAPDPKTSGLKRTLDTKNRNAAASKAQPPSAAKIGADSDALGGSVDEGSVLKMSQDDFAKLSDEALAKMRGDFV
jgi:predicted  nucleic acid-binding Zn-ribbon protein